jgi:D-alanine-D-alanine ligase
MKVGLTYDLRSEYLALGYGEEETAEFDRDDTVTAIEGALMGLGHEAVRIGNVMSLVKKLAAGERWDLVFNIAEGLYGFAREAQVPAVLDAYRIPCTFADAMVLALGLHKGMTKHVVRDLGIATPDFHVVAQAADIAEVKLEYPLFAKPVAEGTSKGITGTSVIDSASELRAVCLRLLAECRQPVLVERFLPGREFTVGIVGSGDAAEVVGALEVVERQESGRMVYSYENKERCEELIDYRLARDEPARKSCALALAAWRGLGCRDAGRVDVRMDEAGNPGFIEVNPLAGLHPTHSDLPIMWQLAGRRYPDLVGRIVDSARVRVHSPGTR